ncbi:MAG TPA: FxDxF family PEP-CTERM protein [Phenylobacterium sp.]|nr:FxDxF family PEP-CTERM protein [Phenylobacterium sp.]HZZ66646.1 FxDxF family PEP-CTERM protein [Phenylobacterium sp.]
MLAGCAALALAAAGSAANAAQTITFGTPVADGSFTGTFGDTDITKPTFTDTYTFNMPTGVAAATISSIFTTDDANNIDFTSVTLDGNPFDIVSTGQVEFRSINNVLVSSGQQTLVVSGTSGGAGSYSGTLSFETASPITIGVGGVPEPAGWALMIMGFGGVGALLRSRRKVASALA